MKKLFLLTILFILTILLFSEEIVTRADGSKIVIYDDHTWAEHQDGGLSIEEIVQKNKDFLRSGVQASASEVSTACVMYEQGWTYTMPRPKSAQARWGNSDGRTTWYNGWWHNSKSGLYSDSTPRKSSSGLYLGDNQNSARTWSRGGSPGRPDVYMYLLSKSGGPK